MNLKKYTEDQLRSAVANSVSYRQVLIKLGVVPAGGNYQTLKRAVAHFKLDTSHMLGQSWSKGSRGRCRKPIEVYLINGSMIQSNKLRLRLLRDGVFEHKCSKCHNTVWNGEPIPLELDHINGVNDDNRIENLRLLCPNCHAQTSTYRGKNIRRK